MMLDWTSLWLCWPFLMVAGWLLCVHHYAHIPDEKKVTTMWVFCVVFFLSQFSQITLKDTFSYLSIHTVSCKREWESRHPAHILVASQKNQGYIYALPSQSLRGIKGKRGKWILGRYLIICVILNMFGN